MKVFHESDALQENFKYFNEVNDFMKDAIETYMIMRRQREREILSDAIVNNLIRCISRCRFNIGELLEQYMIYDRNFLDKVLKIVLSFFVVKDDFLEKKRGFA